MSLPPDYDNTKAYPLVLEGPGCGGQGNDLYDIPALSNAAIRVGLSPSANAQAFHPVSPGQGCFDDREGDDSVDWVFYENLYDKLAAEVCFDRNRVFAAGNSTGARMANELGCKYAGDAFRPVRGVMTRGPALPVETKYQPSCTTKPMAGMWVDQINNPEYAFAETTLAVTRAMGVNGCTIGTSYETAEFEPFSISSTDGSSCKMVKGCPALFPLVICPLLSVSNKTGDTNVVVPGWTAFFKLFDP
jgi:poly(3-hydroxybutyrate) depolymerase